MEAHLQSLGLSLDSSAAGWPALPREISGKMSLKNPSNKTTSKTAVVYTHTHTHKYIYMYIHAHTHIYMPMYVYMYVATKGVEGFFL